MMLVEKDFPIEIVEPIKGLSNKIRRRILLSLLENNSIAYSQIRDSLQIGKGTLNHHLHILTKAGLIRNFGIDRPGSPYNSYYSITEFGRKFVEELFQTLEPTQQRRIVTSTTITDEIIKKTITSTTTTYELVTGSASKGEEPSISSTIPVQNRS